ELAHGAVALFEAALADGAATDVEAFRASLSRLAARTLEAQPSMAPLLALASAVLLAASGTASVQEAREQARRAVARFRERLTSATRDAAARAEGLVPAGGRLLTLSSSSTVRAALLEAAKRRSFDVVC